MISDETKAAIVKKSSAAAHAAVVLNASPRFDNLINSPLSNLNMIADAAATAEPSVMVRDDYTRGRRTLPDVECEQIRTRAPADGGDPRITSAVHRLEALMQPVGQRKDGGFQAIRPHPNQVQLHPQAAPSIMQPPPPLRHKANSLSNLYLAPESNTPVPQPQPSQTPPSQTQIPQNYSNYQNHTLPPLQQQPQEIYQQETTQTHKPIHLKWQQAPPAVQSATTATLNMTAITTQLHLNATQIPPPQTYTHPTLGPTVSWTSNILAEANLKPQTDLSEAHRRAFTQCDALILAAVKERNQFLEISRALVQECGKHQEIGAKYLGILRQLVGIVPQNVRVGVKMDLEAIERFSRSEVALSSGGPPPLVAAASAPVRTMSGASSALNMQHPHQFSSRQQSFEHLDCSVNPFGKRSGSPMSVLGDKRMRGDSTNSAAGDSVGSVESPELEYRWKSATPEQADTAFPQVTVPTVGESPILNTRSVPPEQQQQQQHQQQQNAHPRNHQKFPPMHIPGSTMGCSTIVSMSVLPPPPPPTHDNNQLPSITRKSLPAIMQVNAPTGYTQYSKVVNKNVVCAMALSRPFKYLFTACGGTIKIWDISTSLPEAPQVGTIELNYNHNESSYIRTIKISSDGKTLVAGGEGQDVSICNINTTQPHVTAKLPTNGHDTYSITLSHDGQTCLVGGSDNKIHLWDMDSLTHKLTFSGHTGAVTCTSLSRDGKKLYSGSCDGSVRLWDVSSGQCLERFGFRSGVHGFDLNPLIPILTVGLEDGVAQRYLTRDVGRLGNGVDDGSVYLDVGDVDGKPAPWGCARYSRSGLWFTVAGMNGKMCVFKEGNLTASGNGASGAAVSMCTVLAKADGKDDPVSIICTEVSSCGNFVVMGCSDKTAKVFRVTP
ncbi:WD40-repeat-containing domain protein [Obelidium mucronatum]|nr:WD40-repeat-containing domain protein [Obelidium mucronatum]